MKKEWIYFIAGAGLAVAIMFALDQRYSDFEECTIKEGSKIKNPSGYHRGVIDEFCLRFEEWKPEK